MQKSHWDLALKLYTPEEYIRDNVVEDPYDLLTDTIYPSL